MGSFGIRLQPKIKPWVLHGLFLIALRIEWYKLHSHSANCTEVTAFCLQRYIASETSAYAFSVNFF